MPNTRPHTVGAHCFASVLEAWVERAALDAFVYENLAFRWDALNRSRGVDPDVMLVQPAPPDPEGLRSLRGWVPGHSAPRLALEIVSTETAARDYKDLPTRYGPARVPEVVVFDPERHGPASAGGPVLLQVWRRARNGRLVRVFAGDGPFQCDALNAWLVPIDRYLRVADDPLGQSLWPTIEETAENRADSERNQKIDAQQRVQSERRLKILAEERAENERGLKILAEQRAENEAQRAEAQAQRAENERLQKITAEERAEEALARVAALEALVARLRG